MMKKILLGTTALIAASAISAPAFSAERIQLQLRGYHVGGMAYVDGDYDRGYRDVLHGGSYSSGGIGDYNEINFGSDSEIHFIGSTTLDNGLEISFRAELELEQDHDAYGWDWDDTIDEVYVQVQGGFGRLQFGQQDGAMDQMAVVAPLIFKEHGHSDPDLDPFDPFWSNPIDTVGDNTGDDIKIIYFTPDMSGFQLGFSYTPNPCKNAQGYPVCVWEEVGRNYWEVSGTFETDIDNIHLALSGGFGQGEQGGASQEPSEWTLGAQIGFGGLVIGGSYKDEQNAFGGDQQHWDAGVSYTTGPWMFNLAYGNAEGAIYGSQDLDDAESWIAGLAYMYGPGMQIGIGVNTLDVSDQYFNGHYLYWEGFDGTSVFIENSITF